MKISYEDAMNNLKTMFSEIDEGVIQTVLLTHKGKLDPTIEDLLKLGNNTACEEENIFEEISDKNTQCANKDGQLPEEETLDDMKIASIKQEKEDMQLALQLQQKYLNDATIARPLAIESTSNGQAVFIQHGQVQPRILYVQPVIEHVQSHQQQAQSPSSKKSKTTFSQKMKNAKAKFLKMFKKGKKKANNETGNLREFDIAWDGDSYQIPDIQLHPYTEQHDKLQPVKKSFKSTAKSTKKSTAKSPAKIAVKKNSNDTDKDVKGQNASEIEMSFKLLQQEDIIHPVSDDDVLRNSADYSKPEHVSNVFLQKEHHETNCNKLVEN